jgi:hypothetical protein
MSTRRSASQPLGLALLVTLLGACSDDTMTAFPEEDASAQEDAPTFDVPSTDTGFDAGTDRGTVPDTTPPRDRGSVETTVCPASCGASSECDPCRTADTPSTVQYCCISGLCVSMTGTCPAFTDGGPGDAMPSDAAEGGADAPGGDDAVDPTDDAPDPTDDTGTPPADTGPASDLGGDAASGDASAADATATMDAADGRD